MSLDKRSIGLGILLTGSLVALLSAPQPQPTPNLIVVAIDTVRADRLGAWGHDRDTTPRIDALAADGLRFENAYAPATWTLPSVMSYLSGLPPHVHGMDRWGDVVPAESPWLPSALKAGGYTTAAVVGNGGLNRQAGFARGFDVFAESWTMPTLQRDGLPNYPSASAMTDHALTVLDAVADGGPFFLYVHYMDPHSPYLLPSGAEDPFVDAGYDGFIEAELEPIRSVVGSRPGQITGHFWSRVQETAADRARVRSLYDAKLRYVDGQIGRLLDAVDAGGLREDTWIVVLSDHGEGLYDHGVIEHANLPYEHQVRVPLAVRAPGLEPRVIDEAVELVDLPAALSTALLGVDGALGKGGNGALPWALGQEGGEAPGDATISQTGPMKARSVRQGTHKLIDVAGEARLFDLGADPRELNDLAATEPDRVAELQTILQARFAEGTATAPGTVDLTEDQLEALRALGYVDP